MPGSTAKPTGKPGACQRCVSSGDNNNDSSQPETPAYERRDAPGAFIIPYEVRPLVVVFGVVSVCLGVALTVLMAMLLAAQRRLECGALRPIGGVFLVVGLLLIAAGIFAVKRWAVQPRETPADSQPTTPHHPAANGKPGPATAGDVDRASAAATATPPPEEKTSGSRCCRPATAGKVCGCIGITIVYLVLLALCLLGAVVWIMSRNTPLIKISRDEAPGLSGVVHIRRDEYGIPHIDAATRDDTIFAQGFITAQDRLVQLEVIRLASQGRLSEYVGSAGLDMDKASRACGFYIAGAASCAVLNGTARSAWQRYADGINFYLAKDGNRPPEFMFFGQPLVFHEPEPFTLLDLCISAKLVQFGITRSAVAESERWKLFADVGLTSDEIYDLDATVFDDSDSIFNNSFAGFTAADTQARRAREAADDALERELYRTVMPRYRNNESATNGNGASASRRQQAGAADSESSSATTTSGQKKRSPRGLSEFLDFSGLMKGVMGSNAWAARAAGGSVVVASDPHLLTQLPPFWYPFYANVRDSDWGFGGCAVASIPGVMIGRNSRVAWGITISYSDLGDLYVMVPDPARPSTHYIHNGVSRAYNIRTERIKVRYGDDEILTVRESIYGPDIAEAWELTTKHTICLSARTIEPDATTMPALINLVTPGEVVTVSDIRAKVFGLVQSPGLSIALGDSSGGIGYAVTGQHKIRAPGHTGRLPILGNGSFDYVGTYAFSQIPGFANTDGSAMYIAAANQKISAPGDPVILTREFLSAYRGNAIKNKFAAAPQSSWSSVALTMAIQLNEESNAWLMRVKPLLDNTSNPLVAQLITQLDSRGLEMLRMLNAWDGVSDVGSRAPSFLWVFLIEIAKLPLAARSRLEWNSFSPEDYGVHVLYNPTNITEALCRQATGGENCATYAARTWNRVAADGTKEWGTEINLGQLRHLLVHGTPLQCMFSRYVPRGGDRTSINVAWQSLSYDTDGRHGVAGGPSMRFINDWSTPDRYLFALPGGASGNPFSDYYTNLVHLWATNKYATVLLENYRIRESQFLKS